MSFSAWQICCSFLLLLPSLVSCQVEVNLTQPKDLSLSNFSIFSCVPLPLWTFKQWHPKKAFCTWSSMNNCTVCPSPMSTLTQSKAEYECLVPNWSCLVNGKRQTCSMRSTPSTHNCSSYSWRFFPWKVKRSSSTRPYCPSTQTAKGSTTLLWRRRGISSSNR